MGAIERLSVILTCVFVGFELFASTAAANAITQRSLVIVFDTTKSMEDDLVQLREAAIKIVEEFKALENNPIYNYVLSPFNDPETEFLPLQVTTDPSVLIEGLNALYLSSVKNSDCPELSLTGIINALSADIRNPIVYVLTDAMAKDYEKSPIVKNLIETTQAQVNFLVTGSCKTKPEAGYIVYETIAMESGGLVFNMTKGDVKDVLFVLKKSLEEGTITISSVFYDSAGSHQNPIDIDETMDRVIVTLAGADPIICITGPDNQVYKDISKLLTLKYIVAIQIDHPVAGKYILHTESSSRYRINVDGKSDFSLNYGFSLTEPDSSTLSDILFVPAKNESNILNFVVSDDARVTLKEVILESCSTNQSLDLSYREIDKVKFYTSTSFIPPNENFKIILLGSDSKGNTFQRLVSHNLKASSDISPIVMIKKHKKTFIGDSFDLICSVDSLNARNIQWLHNGHVVKEFKRTDNATIHLVKYSITKATESHSGKYTCRASNGRGVRTSHTDVQIEDLPTVTIKTSMSSGIRENDDGSIQCVVGNIENDIGTIKWFFEDKLLNTESLRERNNLNLVNIKRDASGNYTCEIHYELKNIAESIHIKVLYHPEIEKNDGEIVIREQQDGVLKCKVDSPIPFTIQWEYDNKTILTESDRLELDYTLRNVRVEDSGYYYCSVKNSVDEAKISYKVTVEPLPKPFLKLSPEVAELTEYDNELALTCELINGESTSIAAYKWSLNDTILSELSSQLYLKNINRTGGGKYSCSATVNEEISSNYSIVNVIYPPTVKLSLINPKINLNDSLKFSCLVESNLPVESIQWIFNDTILNRTLTGSTLDYEKENVGEDDAGQYICRANNRAGEGQDQIQIEVLTDPTVGVYPKVQVFDEKATKLVSIHCRILNNIDGAVPTWNFNGSPLTRGETSILKNNTLLIKNFEEEDNGEYTCSLLTPKGNVEDTAKVTLSPALTVEIQEGKELQLLENDVFRLNCLIHSTVPVQITWSKHGKTLKMESNTKLRILELAYQGAQFSDADDYTCTAMNAHERVSQKITVRVIERLPPIIKVNPLSHSVKEDLNETVSFHCSVQNVDSTEDIYWSHNGKRIRVDNVTDDHTFTLKNVNRKMAGNYSCEVAYYNFRERANVTLNVKYPPSFKKISFIKGPIHSSFGSNVSFDCNADGNPKPVVSWKFQGFGAASPLPKPGSEIAFSEMMSEYEGVYTCMADSGPDFKPISHSFSLIGRAIKKPKLSTNDGNLAKHVKEGDSVELLCECEECRPLKSFAWQTPSHTFDGQIYNSQDNMIVQRLDRDNERNQFRYKLELKPVQIYDSGKYICEVENAYGKDSLVYELIVAP